MVNPTVDPPKAAQHGCSSSYETAGSESGVNASGDPFSYTHFRLTACEAPGWEFDHFEYVWRETTSDGRYDPYDDRMQVDVRYCEREGNCLYYPRRDVPDSQLSYYSLYEGTVEVTLWPGTDDEDHYTSIRSIQAVKAVFKEKEIVPGTGKILYSPATGKIIYQDGGNILYDD